MSDVRGINLENGEVTVYRNITAEYNEVKEIYPNNMDYILIETAHDQNDPDDNYAIEIWRMKLEPNSQYFVRLTW